MTNRQLGLAAAAAVAALSACSKSTTASAPSVRTKAATYGSSVATNLQGAVDALNSASSLAALNNGLAPLQHAFGGSVGALSPVSSGTPAFLSSRRSVRSFARLGSSASTPGASTPGTALTAEQSSTLEQFLSQRVFTDANVESSDGSSVTFLLHGDDVCPYVLPDGSRSLLAASGGTLDAGCAEDVDQQQIRVKASEPASDALDLALLIGPARAAPLTLELRTNSVAAVVSLDGVKGVLEFEHTLDAASPVPQAMTGVVDLKVVFNRVVSGKVDVTFSSSVRQAVDVQVQDATGTTTLATAARSPWASLQVNGIDQAVAAQLDLGPTTVSAPYYVSADNAYRQEVTSLAGMSFSFSAQDGQAGDFVISNLGLGDARTSVSLAGQDVFRADLPPLRDLVQGGSELRRPDDLHPRAGLPAHVLLRQAAVRQHGPGPCRPDVHVEPERGRGQAADRALRVPRADQRPVRVAMGHRREGRDRDAHAVRRRVGAGHGASGGVPRRFLRDGDDLARATVRVRRVPVTLARGAVRRPHRSPAV